MNESIDPDFLRARERIKHGLDQIRNGQCVELDGAEIAGIKERGRRRLLSEENDGSKSKSIPGCNDQ